MPINRPALDPNALFYAKVKGSTRMSCDVSSVLGFFREGNSFCDQKGNDK